MGFDLSPQTFEQAMTFSNMLAESDLVPKDFKGKPGNCLIAMQWGSELGLKPLQSLQNLASGTQTPRPAAPAGGRAGGPPAPQPGRSMSGTAEPRERIAAQ